MMGEYDEVDEVEQCVYFQEDMPRLFAYRLSVGDNEYAGHPEWDEFVLGSDGIESHTRCTHAVEGV